MINKYKWYEKLGIYLGVAAFLTFILAPFVESFFMSLRPWREIFSIPYQMFSEGMSFDAYFRIWRNPFYALYIWNSFFIATCVTLLCLLAGIPAAWAFARFDFRGNRPILVGLVAITLLGPTVFIVPLFKIFMHLGLLNSYFAVIVPGAAFLMPVCIWLMRAYMVTIPQELEEAAWVDGASRLYILWRVIVPLSKPGIVVATLAAFIGAYSQQFLLTFAFNSKQSLYTLPLGLLASGSFPGENTQMAAGLVGILPVMILFYFLQKHIMSGLTAGAVKS